jgi:hypothetical protein
VEKNERSPPTERRSNRSSLRNIPASNSVSNIGNVEKSSAKPDDIIRFTTDFLNLCSPFIAIIDSSLYTQEYVFYIRKRKPALKNLSMFPWPFWQNLVTLYKNVSNDLLSSLQDVNVEPSASVTTQINCIINFLVFFESMEASSNMVTLSPDDKSHTMERSFSRIILGRQNSSSSVSTSQSQKLINNHVSAFNMPKVVEESMVRILASVLRLLIKREDLLSNESILKLCTLCIELVHSRIDQQSNWKSFLLTWSINSSSNLKSPIMMFVVDEGITPLLFTITEITRFKGIFDHVSLFNNFRLHVIHLMGALLFLKQVTIKNETIEALRYVDSTIEVHQFQDVKEYRLYLRSEFRYNMVVFHLFRFLKLNTFACYPFLEFILNFKEDFHATNENYFGINVFPYFFDFEQLASPVPLEIKHFFQSLFCVMLKDLEESETLKKEDPKKSDVIDARRSSKKIIPQEILAEPPPPTVAPETGLSAWKKRLSKVTNISWIMSNTSSSETTAPTSIISSEKTSGTIVKETDAIWQRIIKALCEFTETHLSSNMICLLMSFLEQIIMAHQSRDVYSEFVNANGLVIIFKKLDQSDSALMKRLESFLIRIYSFQSLDISYVLDKAIENSFICPIISKMIISNEKLLDNVPMRVRLSLLIDKMDADICVFLASFISVYNAMLYDFIKVFNVKIFERLHHDYVAKLVSTIFLVLSKKLKFEAYDQRNSDNFTTAVETMTVGYFNSIEILAPENDPELMESMLESILTVHLSLFHDFHRLKSKLLIENILEVMADEEIILRKLHIGFERYLSLIGSAVRMFVEDTKFNQTVLNFIIEHYQDCADFSVEGLLKWVFSVCTQNQEFKIREESTLIDASILNSLIQQHPKVVLRGFDFFISAVEGLVSSKSRLGSINALLLASHTSATEIMLQFIEEEATFDSDSIVNVKRCNSLMSSLQALISCCCSVPTYHRILYLIRFTDIEPENLMLNLSELEVENNITDRALVIPNNLLKQPLTLHSELKKVYHEGLLRCLIEVTKIPPQPSMFFSFESCRKSMLSFQRVESKFLLNGFSLIVRFYLNGIEDIFRKRTLISMWNLEKDKYCFLYTINIRRNRLLITLNSFEFEISDFEISDNKWHFLTINHNPVKRPWSSECELNIRINNIGNLYTRKLDFSTINANSDLYYGIGARVIRSEYMGATYEGVDVSTSLEGYINSLYFLDECLNDGTLQQIFANYKNSESLFDLDENVLITNYMADPSVGSSTTTSPKKLCIPSIQFHVNLKDPCYIIKVYKDENASGNVISNILNKNDPSEYKAVTSRYKNIQLSNIRKYNIKKLNDVILNGGQELLPLITNEFSMCAIICILLNYVRNTVEESNLHAYEFLRAECHKILHFILMLRKRDLSVKDCNFFFQKFASAKTNDPSCLVLNLISELSAVVNNYDIVFDIFHLWSRCADNIQTELWNMFCEKHLASEFINIEYLIKCYWMVYKNRFETDNQKKSESNFEFTQSNNLSKFQFHFQTLFNVLVKSNRFQDGDVKMLLRFLIHECKTSSKQQNESVNDQTYFNHNHDADDSFVNHVLSLLYNTITAPDANPNFVSKLLSAFDNDHILVLIQLISKENTLTLQLVLKIWAFSLKRNPNFDSVQAICFFKYLSLNEHIGNAAIYRSVFNLVTLNDDGSNAEIINLSVFTGLAEFIPINRLSLTMFINDLYSLFYTNPRNCHKFVSYINKDLFLMFNLLSKVLEMEMNEQVVAEYKSFQEGSLSQMLALSIAGIIFHNFFQDKRAYSVFINTLTRLWQNDVKNIVKMFQVVIHYLLQKIVDDIGKGRHMLYKAVTLDNIIQFIIFFDDFIFRYVNFRKSFTVVSSEFEAVEQLQFFTSTDGEELQTGSLSSELNMDPKLFVEIVVNLQTVIKSLEIVRWMSAMESQSEPNAARENGAFAILCDLSIHAIQSNIPEGLILCKRIITELMGYKLLLQRYAEDWNVRCLRWFSELEDVKPELEYEKLSVYHVVYNSYSNQALPFEDFRNWYGANHQLFFQTIVEPYRKIEKETQQSPIQSTMAPNNPGVEPQQMLKKSSSSIIQAGLHTPLVKSLRSILRKFRKSEEEESSNFKIYVSKINGLKENIILDVNAMIKQWIFRSEQDYKICKAKFLECMLSSQLFHEPELTHRYALDPTETFSRMRRRLQCNDTCSDHALASSKRDRSSAAPESQITQMASKTPSFKKLSISSLAKSSRNGSKSADKFDLEGNDLDEWNLLDGKEITNEMEKSTKFNVESLFSNQGNEKMMYTADCELVVLMTTVPGKLELTSHNIYFIVNAGQDAKGRKSSNPEKSSGADCFSILDQSYTSNQKWSVSSLTEIHLRRYMLRRSAIEFFFSDQRNYLFNFFSIEERNRLYAKVLNVKPPNLTKYDMKSSPSEMFKKSSAILAKWQRHEISNFEYLMHLNTLSGRTFNDLTQYPVFPWILTDYESETIDLQDPKIYRDLSKPIGALNPQRLESFVERYNTFEDPVGRIPKFHYGTHYSTAASVLYYMLRLEPFTSLHIQLQGGKFDHSDRQFHSLYHSFRSCYNGTSDVKELIPEFFYCPEFLENVNRYDLGIRQNEEKLDNVILPPYAKTSEEFIRVHRMALESDYVSEHLNEWIDLIFGYKQLGEEAIKAHNVFYYLTYEGAVNLDDITDAVERKAIESQIHNFGQTPSQLLGKPHPKRLTTKDILSITLFQSLYFRTNAGPESNVLNATVKTIKFSSSPLLYLDIKQISLPSIVGVYQVNKLVTVDYKCRIGLHKIIYNSNNLSGAGTPTDSQPGTPELGRRSDINSNIADLIELENTNAADYDRGIDLFYHRKCQSSSIPVQISFDGRFAFVGGLFGHSLAVVSVDSGRTIQYLNFHRDFVSCLAQSENGKVLISGGHDGLLVGFEVNLLLNLVVPNSGVLAPMNAYYYGHDSEIVAIECSHDCDIVVSASASGKCLLHSLKTSRLLRQLVIPEEIRQFYSQRCPVRFIRSCNQSGRILIVLTQTEKVKTNLIFNIDTSFVIHDKWKVNRCSPVARDGV